MAAEERASWRSAIVTILRCWFLTMMRLEEIITKYSSLEGDEVVIYVSTWLLHSIYADDAIHRAAKVYHLLSPCPLVQFDAKDRH
jgi:hypothetical protein